MRTAGLAVRSMSENGVMGSGRNNASLSFADEKWKHAQNMLSRRMISQETANDSVAYLYEVFEKKEQASLRPLTPPK